MKNAINQWLFLKIQIFYLRSNSIAKSLYLWLCKQNVYDHYFVWMTKLIIACFPSLAQYMCTQSRGHNTVRNRAETLAWALSLPSVAVTLMVQWLWPKKSDLSDLGFKTMKSYPIKRFTWSILLDRWNCLQMNLAKTIVHQHLWQILSVFFNQSSVLVIMFCIWSG